ncbi:MAG: xylulokinase [Epulopiscium sp.]|nr:xylulokinase [Candidatus Epulonipiscium sp.]
MAYLLGIDIGTSGTKTVLFDLKGKTIASATEEYPLYQPYVGWAEQAPKDWWNAVVATIQAVIKKSGIISTEIQGIGLAGQMHGLVLLNEDNEPLRPSIIWCDQRTDQECIEITEKVGAQKLIDITGNPALTGFTASKIMWVKKHEPEIYERIAHILLPKDYIRLMLTGEYATEVSDASGMQLLNIRERNWSKEILDILEIDRKWLPAVYESQEISGFITKSISQATGLAEGTPVVGGGGDQAAGAIGNGIVESGIISSTIGTSGVVFAYTDEIVIDPKGRIHTFCHAIPDTWHVMGVTQGAGLSLRWFRDEFCQQEKDVAAQMGVDPYNLMTQAAKQASQGSNGLLYLPYLMGERTPHLDPYARGVFFGLSAMHTKREMIRSIMEGITYSLQDCLSILEELNIEVTKVRASGGGAKSELWRQMQSDIFRKEVVTINAMEGPAFGVALLAGIGTGIYKNAKEACNITINEVDQSYPVVENIKIYEHYYKIYCKLYKDLKSTFPMLQKNTMI